MSLNWSQRNAKKWTGCVGFSARSIGEFILMCFHMLYMTFLCCVVAHFDTAFQPLWSLGVFELVTEKCQKVDWLC